MTSSSEKGNVVVIDRDGDANNSLDLDSMVGTREAMAEI